jgi:hypothetical protein
MEPSDAACYRSLERRCRAQAALTTNEVAKRELIEIAEEYHISADRLDRQQAEQ